MHAITTPALFPFPVALTKISLLILVTRATSAITLPKFSDRAQTFSRAKVKTYPTVTNTPGIKSAKQ